MFDLNKVPEPHIFASRELLLVNSGSENISRFFFTTFYLVFHPSLIMAITTWVGKCVFCSLVLITTFKNLIETINKNEMSVLNHLSFVQSLSYSSERRSTISEILTHSHKQKGSSSF